jgi:hypothetical protein
MSTEQWIKLGEAFRKWPFKPDVLEDETYVEVLSLDDLLKSPRHTTELQMDRLEMEQDEDEIDDFDNDDDDELQEADVQDVQKA